MPKIRTKYFLVVFVITFGVLFALLRFGGGAGNSLSYRHNPNGAPAYDLPTGRAALVALLAAFGLAFSMAKKKFD